MNLARASSQECCVRWWVLPRSSQLNSHYEILFVALELPVTPPPPFPPSPPTPIAAAISASSRPTYLIVCF